MQECMLAIVWLFNWSSYLLSIWTIELRNGRCAMGRLNCHVSQTPTNSIAATINWKAICLLHSQSSNWMVLRLLQTQKAVNPVVCSFLEIGLSVPLGFGGLSAYVG